MATIRGFVLSQSTLNTGHTVREHIQNPAVGAGQVIGNLDGTIVIDEILTGTIEEFELIGVVECD